MKIVIIGYFSDLSKNMVKKEFPENWIVEITEPENAGTHIADADIVIPEHIKIDLEFLNKAVKLKFVQTGAGFDNVDINSCTDRGVWVANAAGVNAVAVAEHVMAFILSWYKNMVYLDNFMKNKGDEKKLFYNGSELAGKTIGIIGVGAIGKNVAKYCNAFGMKVLGYDLRKIATDEKIDFVDLETIYRDSDIITVHVFLNEQTRHMINQSVFAKMKNDAIIINTARGPIIDEKALITALKNKEIAAAGLDVFENEPLSLLSELRELKNVLLTPHTAGMPDGLKFHKKRYAFFIKNIKKIISGEKPDSALNNVISKMKL